MKNKNVSDIEVNVMAAALLRSQGLHQKEIAAQIGISQPEVSRLLRRAEEKKWLLPRPPQFHCPESDYHIREAS
jgi:DNA-binding transcriptional regulator LsrR (DeoR family)